MYSKMHNTVLHRGLAAHWVDENFDRKMTVLHCKPFTGRHTALNIASHWQEMTGDGPGGWNIPKKKCSVAISDSAANMVKTFKDLKLSRVVCFAL